MTMLKTLANIERSVCFTGLPDKFDLVEVRVITISWPIKHEPSLVLMEWYIAL